MPFNLGNLPQLDPSVFQQPKANIGDFAQSGLQGFQQGQQMQEMMKQKRFGDALTAEIQSGAHDYKSQEGQASLVKALAGKGFGPEAMDLAGKMKSLLVLPEPENQVPFDAGSAGVGTFGQKSGKWTPLTQPSQDPSAPQTPVISGATQKAEADRKFQADKEEWERKFKERQLKQSGANITKDNELAASKAELARTVAEAALAKKAVDIPEMEAKADAAISTIDQMIGSEDGVTKRHPGFSGYVGAKGPSSLFGLKSEPIGGTAAADFAALYDQVKGGAFMEAVQSMKGTGALSDAEGKAAAGAITRMKASQSEDAFIQAAKEFRTAIKNRKGRVVAKAAGAAAPAKPKTDPLGLF